MSSFKFHMMNIKLKKNKKVAEEDDTRNRSSLGSSSRRATKKESERSKENKKGESDANSKSKGRTSSSFREKRSASVSGSESKKLDRGSTKKSTISRSTSSQNPARPRPNRTESPDNNWITKKPKSGEKRRRQQLSSSSSESESDSDSSLEASSKTRRKPPSSQSRMVKDRDVSPEFSRSVSMSQSPINIRRQKDDEKMEEEEKNFSSPPPPNHHSTSSQKPSGGAGRPSEASNDNSKAAGGICKRPTFKFNFQKREESSSDESSDSDDDDASTPHKSKPSNEGKAASSNKKKPPMKNWGSSSSSSSDDESDAAPTKKKATKADNPSTEKEDVSICEDKDKDKPVARATSNEVDQDDFMERPKKKKTKKKGRAKNPLTIQKEEQMAVTECRNNNLSGKLGGRDDLWSTDEEERERTQAQRRGRGRRPRRNLRVDDADYDENRDNDIGQQPNVGGRRGRAAANAQAGGRPQHNQPSDAGLDGAQQEDDPSSDSDNERDNKRKGRNSRRSPVQKTKDDTDDDDSDSEDFDSQVEEKKREIEEIKRKHHPDLTNPTFGPFDNVPLPLVNKESDTTDHSIPASLARYLPPFQREGISFIYNAVVTGQGAILGDDMGLGKTLQVISLIAALLGKNGTGQDSLDLKARSEAARKLQREADTWLQDAFLGQRRLLGKDEHIVEEKKRMGLSDFVPILVIVPASVVDNWDYEFTMWGHFSVAVYREEKLRDEALNKMKYGEAEIMVCGHSSFSNKNHFKYMSQIKWKLVVVDEFHEFKNPTGTKSKNLTTLKEKSECPVLGMTGTPMQNRYEELHTLVSLINKELLGSKTEFMNRIGKPIMNSRSRSATKEVKELGKERLSDLKGLLQPMYIQRDKTDVLKDLPEKVEEVVFCELSEEQKKVYKHILDLPDFLFVRGSRSPCDCGVNINYFEQYKRLRTRAEKIQYQRNHVYIQRSDCCYKFPKDENAKKSILWTAQHRQGPHKICQPCKKCPYCLLLPCLSILYKLSSDLSLLQYDRSKKNSDDEDKEKREAFSKVCFPKTVLKKLEHIGGTNRCGGIQLSQEQFFMMSGKLKKLLELLKAIEDRKGRVLLFSYSTQTLDVIQEFLNSESYSYLRIDGSTPSKERQGLVNEFQTNDEHFVFLLSTKAAGVGLNLTAANNVIIFDAEWNPALDEQAQDRSWRIGQKRKVMVYRLISQGTIDESRYLRQLYKSGLKKETFRADDGNENNAVPRTFVGVEKDNSRRGELFGLENLLKFSPDSSFTSDTFKALGSSGPKRNKRGSNKLVAGKSDEIAKALADKNADTIMEKEEENEIYEEIERAANMLGNQQDQEDAMSGSPMSESQPMPARENIFRHADFFQNSIKLAHEHPDEVMGGLSQTVDELVCRRNDKSDELSEDDCEGEDGTPAASKGSGRIPFKKESKTNFVLCGLPAWQIKNATTTFSMADIHQPRSARKRKRSRKGL